MNNCDGMHVKADTNKGGEPRRLFGMSLIYTAANALNAVGILLLIPVLTRFLTPEGYGLVSMFAVLMSFAAPFVGLNIHGAIARRYYDLQNEEFAVFVGNCLMILLCSTILALVLLVTGFASVVEKATGLSAFWQRIAVAVCAFQYLGTIFLTYLQVTQKPLSYGAFLATQALLNVVLSLILVVAIELEWQGRVLGQTIALTITGIGAYMLLRRARVFTVQITKSHLVSALKFGIPLVPHTIAAILLVMVDRIYIASVVGLAEVGRYSIAFQFASVMTLLTSGVNSASIPWLYRILSGPDVLARERVVRITYLYIAGLWIVGLVLALSVNLMLPVLVGGEYQGVGPLVNWLVAGAVLNGMYLAVANYIFYAERTYLLSLITVLMLVLHVPLSYLLTVSNGALGAAQASCITLGISFVLTTWASARAVAMPWRTTKIFSF